MKINLYTNWFSLGEKNVNIATTITFLSCLKEMDMFLVIYNTSFKV